MYIKGFDKDLCCRGFRFEVGKTYDTGAADDKIDPCSDTVFHFCKSLQDVHRHYNCAPESGNRFCEVEALGAVVKDGDKLGTNRIKILREITGEELNALKGLTNGNVGVFNIGSHNSGNWNNGHYNSGNRNSGDHNSGYYNSGDSNSGDHNSGHYNSGYHNSGDWNSCNYSNGVFCSEEDTNIRIFNKPSGMSFSEWRKSKYYAVLSSAPFILTEWIDYTEAETNTPAKKATGGYLKTYSYKEACANWWAEMSEGNKEIVKKIPNFDADIFEETTGIKV